MTEPRTAHPPEAASEPPPGVGLLQESHLHATRPQESGFPADPGPLPAAVLWDMDGTLIDSERLWDVSLQATARELGGALSDRARDSLVGVDIDTSIVVLLDDVGVPATPERVAWTYDRLVALTEELFVAGDVDWRPGARAALRTVREAGLRTALVTNSLRQITELALDGIGREFFDVSVCGDEVAAGKPAPTPTCARPSCSASRSGRAWPWRTRRTAPWPPSGPARPCSWCRAGCPFPPGRAARSATTSSG